MKHPLVLITVLLSASSLMADSVDLYRLTLENGDLYSFRIARTDYDKQQVFDLGEQEAPLAPGAAAQIALNAVRHLVPPDYFARLKCGGMRLYQMPNPDRGNALNSKKCMYYIELRTDKGDVLSDMPLLYNSVIVLMDGTPVLLQKR